MAWDCIMKPKYSWAWDKMYSFLCYQMKGSPSGTPSWQLEGLSPCPPVLGLKPKALHELESALPLSNRYS